MHVPLSRDEIADFLHVSAAQVELLWQEGVLERSLHCPHRATAELSYSSVYDVIEYALVSGVLPVTLTKELAALWVFQLAEADDWEGFETASWAKRTKILLEMAVFEGLAKMTHDPADVAKVVISTQATLSTYLYEDADYLRRTMPELCL